MIVDLVGVALDAALHLAEIEHHPLVVEAAGQLDVEQPAFAEKAAFGVEIGEIDDGESLDEQYGHNELAPGLAPAPTFRPDTAAVSRDVRHNSRIGHGCETSIFLENPQDEGINVRYRIRPVRVRFEQCLEPAQPADAHTHC